MNLAAPPSTQGLDRGGELGRLIGELGPAGSPLGAYPDWPQSLKTAVGLMLAAKSQIVLFWGPDFVALYNEAYAPTIGSKHPRALGRPAVENWTELWSDLRPLLQGVHETGETFLARDRQFYIERHGHPEDVYFDISYSAVPDEAGEVGGVLCMVNETTERVVGEQRLRESEARFQAITNSVDQMIWSTRPDGYHDYYNDRWYEFTGMPHGSTDGEAWNGMFHPEDQERARSVWRASLETGALYHIEYRLRHRSGQYRWVLGRAQAMRDEGGRITRWFGTCTDIQEIVEARDVLARSRAELEREVLATTQERDRIWQASRDLLGVADLDGVWLNVNPAWTRVLGWQPGEIVGRTSDWLHHPDDQAKTRSEIGHIAAGTATLAFENRFRTQDGGYRLLSWTAVPVEDRLYAVARDVTEERERQAALLALEARTRLALSAINGVGAWTYDVAADRFRSDENIAALYGLDPGAATAGVPFAEVVRHIHPDDLPVLQERIAAADLEPGDDQIEYRLVPPDGAVRWILSRSNTPEAGPDGSRIVTGIAIDVTERRQLEEQLRQSQKVEAVGQLAGGIAHDFNNMLAVVIGGLNLLQRRLNRGDTDVGKYIDAALEGANRAASLTQRLLAFSRQQPLAPEPIDADRLVHGLTELLARTLGDEIEIETVASAGLWKTRADPAQLENALLNLAVNARDAMPGGGKLTLETGNAHVDDDYARQYGIKVGQYVLIAVTDTGSGMSPEVAAKAFDPFFTTKEVGKGTGLGLSQVFGFVRQSGGHVKVYSEPGHGTTVKIYLPRFYGTAVPEAPKRVVAPVSGGTSREIVMVVEDEKRVRNYSVEALRELGYTVVHASSGREALALLDAGQDITLLFTDVVMPGMTGRQLADEAMRRLPQLKVLYTTGYTRNAIVHGGVLDPGLNVLPKPFGIDRLAEKVRAAIDG